MERVGNLIDKLQELYKSGADNNRLRVTVLELMEELSSKSNDQLEAFQYISVIPAFYNKDFSVKPQAHLSERKETQESSPKLPAEKIEKNYAQIDIAPTVSRAGINTKQTEGFQQDISPLEIPTLAQRPQNQKEEKKSTIQQMLFENSLNKNKELKSINDKIGVQAEESKKNIAQYNTPIKDLRKAIGINDRFGFVHGLFRDDETMYESSLRTINSFRIYQEAEYWIERELKIKLGWNEKSEAYLTFMQVVKRRFS